MSLDFASMIQLAGVGTIDVPNIVLLFNISFIVILVLAAIIGLIRGVWRAGFRFLFVLGSLVALWFLSPKIIDSLMNFPIKDYASAAFGWDIQALKDLPSYLVESGKISNETFIIALSNQDLIALVTGLIEAVMTFFVFFIGGVLIILFSWPISTLLYAFVRYLIPKKLRKQHKVRFGGALIGVAQALVSLSILLMPFSVVNNALSNIDRNNLTKNKEILTFYDLGRIYGDSFAGQLFNAISLPFNKGKQTTLWASDKLLTMQFKTNSIVLTDEVDVFMSAFNELIKAGLIDIVYEADTGLTVYFNANIKDYKLPSGSYNVSNYGSFDSINYNGALGQSYYEWYMSNPQYNPTLWDYSTFSNQFNIPYYEAGYIYKGGELVLDPSYNLSAYLQSLGFEYIPNSLDVATLTSFISANLPQVKLSDPSTWGIIGNWTADSIYDVNVLSAIISTNLSSLNGLANLYTYNPTGGSIPNFALSLNGYWTLGSNPTTLASIMAANLPYFNINFKTWQFSASYGSLFDGSYSPNINGSWTSNINLGGLTNNGSANLDTSLMDSLLGMLSPELASSLLSILSESNIITNTIPVAIDIALALPALQNYIDTAKLDPSKIQLTEEEWQAEIAQLGKVAAAILELDVIGNDNYFGYDPVKVQAVGTEFAKLKIVTKILPAALPAVLPKVVPADIYNGLNLDDIDFTSYNWQTEMTNISKMAANALLLDIQGIADGTIDYFTQDPQAVSAILTSLTQSQLIMDLIPNAVDYALALPAVQEYTKGVSIDLSNTDWAAEIVNLGNVYTEIAKVGGNPLDVKWGLTDPETQAKAAAIEAAIDTLFSSQLINSLLPTLTEIGINYLQPPFSEAVDPDLIDFENLNLSTEIINAFRIYRLVIDENGELNPNIRSYSDETIRTIADYIGASDIIVPLLPNAIAVLAPEYGIDEWVDINKADFENANWADTIYNLVGVAKYFINEDLEPEINISGLTDANILDIATRINNTELIKTLLPSALEKSLNKLGYGEYYSPDMIDFDTLELGSEIGYVLTVLRTIEFEFDLTTSKVKMNIEFTKYTDEMLNIIESQLNASSLLKQLSSLAVELGQKFIPEEYKKFIDFSKLDLENIHFGTEIKNIINILKELGTSIDPETGELKINLDFTTYTDEMIDKVVSSLNNSVLVDQIFNLLLDSFSKILKEEIGFEVDLAAVLPDDVNIGAELGALLRIARSVSLKISKDNTISYNIILSSYSDEQIAYIAHQIGMSSIFANLIQPGIDFALTKLDASITKYIDLSDTDFTTIDLEKEIIALASVGKLVLDADNKLSINIQAISDAKIDDLAAKFNQTTLLNKVLEVGLKGAEIFAAEKYDLSVDTSSIDADSILFGDELARIIRVVKAVKLDITSFEPFSITFNDQVLSYTSEEIDYIAGLIGNSDLVNKLLPVAAEAGYSYIPDTYKVLVDLDALNYDEIDLGAELANIAKVAQMFFTSNNKIFIDVYNLTDEEVAFIASTIGESSFVNMLITPAVYALADNSKELFGIDINEYVDLKAIADYSELDLTNEFDSLIRIARAVLTDENKVKYRIDAPYREEIKNSINKMELIQILLPTAIDKFAQNEMVAKYVDLTDLDMEKFDLGAEISGLLEVVYELTTDYYTLKLELSAIKNEKLVDAAVKFLNNSEIIKLLEPSAIEKLFANQEFGIDLNDYLDKDLIDLSVVNIGDEVKPFLLIAGALIQDDNKIDTSLSFTDAELAKISAAFDATVLIPQLINNVQTKVPSILGAMYDTISGFIDIPELDLTTDVSWGKELVSYLKIATVLLKVSDTNSVSLDLQLSDADLEIIRKSLNNSELLVRIVENAIHTTINNATLLSSFKKDFKIADFYDFAGLDLRNTQKLGDEITNLLYIAREFITEDNKFNLDLGNLSDDVYTAIRVNINKSKLIPFVVDAIARRDYTFTIKGTTYHTKDYINFVGYDFYDFPFGDDLVKLIKAAQVFLSVDGKTFALKYKFTEAEMNTLANNIGSLKTLDLVLDKGLPAALAISGLDQYITLDDIKYSNWIMEVELYNILKIVNVLDIDLENPVSMLNITEEQSVVIGEAVSNSFIIKNLLPASVGLGLYYAKSLGYDFTGYVDLDKLDLTTVDWGDELVRIFKTLQYLDFKLETEPFAVSVNTDISTYTKEAIEGIAKQIGGSKLIKTLLPIGAAIGVDYIPAEYRDFVNLDDFDFDSINLEYEIATFAKAAQLFFGEGNKLVVDLQGLTDADIALIANVGTSSIIKMAINTAVYKLADRSASMFGIDLNQYVDLKAVDYNALDLANEIDSLVRIARLAIIVDINTMKFDYNLRYYGSQRNEIRDSLNKMSLINELLPSAIDKFATNDMIEPYVDLTALDVEQIKLGDEVAGILEIVYELTNHAGELKYSIAKLQDTELVELVARVINDSKIISLLAPSAIDKAFDNQMLLDSGIDLSTYLTREDIDVSAIKWGDEIKPFLYILGAMSIYENEIEVSLNFNDIELRRIGDAFNASKLIPQLISNVQGNVDSIVAKFGLTDIYEKISNYIDVPSLDLVNGVKWGDEIVNLIKMANTVVVISDDYKISFDLQLTDLDIETIRTSINRSELIARIFDNAIETSTYNPDILSPFVEDLTIAEYYDFSTLDVRNVYKLGDEIANVLYIAREFITEDNKISLSLGDISDATYELIRKNINKSKLIPYIINAGATIAVDYFGFIYEGQDIMLKDYIDLSDVDLTTIAYGDEVVRFLKSVNVFLVPGQNKYQLKYDFTEIEKNLIASNIGKSELLGIALEKGIIAGLKLFGLDSSISIDDIKYSSWDLKDEVYNILTIVDQVDVDLENPLSMINLDEMQITLIGSAISNSRIFNSVIPVALSYVADHSEELFNIPVDSYVDLTAIDYSVIDWGKEVKALLTLGTALVSEVNGKLAIALDITDAEYARIETYFNASKLIPQLVPNVQDHIDNFLSSSVLDMVAQYVDINALDLTNGISWGNEIVDLLKIAQTVVSLSYDEAKFINVTLNLDITNQEIETIRKSVNRSELIVRVVENALAVVNDNPDLISSFIKDATISDYYDLTSLDFRNEFKLGDELANALYIGREFITEDNKFELSLGDFDDTMYEIVRTNVNKSKLIPHLVAELASLAVDYYGFVYGDLEIMLSDYVDLSDVDLTTIAYGDEIVRGLKAAAVFLVPGENKYQLKYDFTEMEKNIISANLGRSELLNIALEKGIIAGLKLYGLDSSISIEDINYSSWDLKDEIYNILTIVDNLDINLEKPLEMLKLNDYQISLIGIAIGDSKIISNVIPVAASYVFDNSEKLFGIDLSTYTDLSKVDYSVIDWGVEISTVLRGARHFITSNGGFGIPKSLDEFDIVEVAKDLQDGLNRSTLIPQLLDISSQVLIDNEITFNNSTYVLRDYIDISELDFYSYNYGDELVGLVEIAEIFVTNDLSYYVRLDLTDAQFTTIETNLNNSMLIKDVLTAALDRVYANNIANVKDLVQLPVGFSFASVEDWGSEIVGLARIASEYVDVTVEGKTVDYSYSIKSISKSSIEQLRTHINNSILIPVVIDGAIRALDTNPYINDLLDKQLGVTVSELVDVDTLDLDVTWGDEIASFAYIARLYLENGQFVLRIKKNSEDINTIATNVSASELIKKLAPVAIDVIDTHYPKIGNITIADYIDLSRLDLSNVDYGTEVGMALTLASLVFDYDNNLIFNFNEMDSQFIETVRFNVNKSSLIPQVIQLAADKARELNTYDVNSYVDLSLVDFTSYNYGDELAAALKIAKIFVETDATGRNGFKISYDPNLTDAEINTIQAQVNGSRLINDLIPNVADTLYTRNFMNVQVYINLSNFDYEAYDYGTEIANVLKVAREVLTVDGNKYDYSKVYSLEEASITKIVNAINNSELIPDVVPLVLEMLPEFTVNGEKVSTFVDVNKIIPELDVVRYGDEVGYALRIMKAYFEAVDGGKLVNLEDSIIETVRTNVNASKLVRIAAQPVVDKLLETNRGYVNSWVDLTKLDLDTVVFGDEIANAAYVAREFFDFDKQTFTLASLATMPNIIIDDVARYINKINLIAQIVPLVAEKINTNEHLYDYIKVNFDIREYVDLSTIDYSVVKYGDEFRHIVKVAKLFTDDFEHFSLNIKDLSTYDLEAIRTELDASTLIPQVIPNAASHEKVQKLYNIDQYVSIDSIDYTDINWGSEAANALEVAQLLINDNNEWDLRLRYSDSEIALIKSKVAASTLLPRAVPSVIDRFVANNVYSVNDWVDLHDLDTDTVNWAKEVENALVLVRYFTIDDVDSKYTLNVKPLTSAEIDDVQVRVNESTIIPQLLPSVIEHVDSKNLYDVNKYVELTSATYEDVVWGDEAAGALRILNNYIVGFGVYDLNLAYIEDSFIELVRTELNASKLVKKLAPSAAERFATNNNFGVNDWVDLSLLDTTVVHFGDEVADALTIAKMFSSGYDFFIKFNFTEDEITTIKTILNNSSVVAQLAESAIHTAANMNRFGVNTYADGLASIDFSGIVWGDEAEAALRIVNTVIYDDGTPKIFYQYSDSEIATIKENVAKMELVPLVAQNVVDTFARNDLYQISNYVDLVGLDVSTIDWENEVELGLQVISYFTPYEGTLEFLFDSITDEQIDRLSALTGNSKLIPLVAPRAVSTVFAKNYVGITDWLDESAFDYAAINYANEVKAGLILLRAFTDSTGAVLTSLDFTDDQIATAKTAVSLSGLVGMLAPSAIEHLSTNGLIIDPALIDASVLDYSLIDYASEAERFMLVARILANEDGGIDTNLALLTDVQIDTIAANLGGSEFVNQLAESTIENALDLFDIPYFEIGDFDFVGVDYEVEIRTILKVYKLLADEEGNITEDSLKFDVLADKADDLGLLVAQSQLITSALPDVLPRALPYDEDTFPYDLTKVDYTGVTWATEFSSLVKMLNKLGVNLDEGTIEFDLQTAERDDVVELGGYLSGTKIGQYIVGEAITDAIVGFNFAGITESDLDYSKVNNWGTELVKLYDIIQVVVDEDGKAKDFATLSQTDADELAANLGTSDLFSPLLEKIIIETITSGGYDDIVPTAQLYFGTDVDPLDWTNELSIFLGIYRTINTIDFDHFTSTDLDKAEGLLTDMLDSKVIFTNAYPYVFANAAGKMGLDGIEGANFEVEYLKTEIHSLGRTAWEDEITALCDLYREVEDLGGIDNVNSITLQTIIDSHKSVPTVFTTIANLILDSKILGIPTLTPIITDTIDLGNDSHGNHISLADTSLWDITDWRSEVTQLGVVLEALGELTPEYDFAAITLDVNTPETNNALGYLINVAYDSALLKPAINTKITDVITSYESITDYVDITVIPTVRSMDVGTAKEGWIGEINTIQSIRTAVGSYDLTTPDSIATMSKETLLSVALGMRDSYLLNGGLPRVIKNALIGVSVDEMLDYGLVAGQPSRFDALPFDMVKDKTNNEVNKLVDLFASVNELGSLSDIDWADSSTSTKFAKVIINLVKTDLFNGAIAIPTTGNSADVTDPDVLLIDGILRNAGLEETLDAVKIINIAGDDIVSENVVGYTPKLALELDVIVGIKDELFKDDLGNASDSINYNRITADVLKDVNHSAIVKDSALPKMLKEALMGVGFDDYVNASSNPTAFNTMNFEAIKDDEEIDRIMGLYTFIKNKGSMSDVNWNALTNNEVGDNLTIVTTSTVIMPVRGIIVNKVLTSIGFSGYYTEADIEAVDAADGWAKEIEAIKASLSLVKTLNSGSNALTTGSTDTFAIRAMMTKADDSILMNRIVRGVLDEQMRALGVSPATFTWVKADRTQEVSLADASSALTALIDLSKLMSVTTTSTSTTKLGTNLIGKTEYKFDINMPDYKDTTVTVDKVERIFTDLQATGNPDGRKLVDALMGNFIKDAVGEAKFGAAFASISWTTINYVDEYDALTQAALVDTEYSTVTNRDTADLVALIERMYTIPASGAATVRAPFAIAFMTASDAKIRLNATEAEDSANTYVVAPNQYAKMLAYFSVFVTE